MAAPLRVLIVSEMSPPYTTGGGETRYALLARQLAALGHAVTWLSMRQKHSPAQETVAGVHHLHTGPRIQRPPQRPLSAKLRFMAAVFLHLLRHRYDVVDCQTYAPLPAAWLACRLRRMPLVATIHDTAAAQGQGDQWLSRFDRHLATLVERRLYRLGYDHVLTVSAAVRDDLVRRFGLRPDRVTAVPNGIDLAAIAATAADPRPADLVFVGRLIPHKHPADLLQVAAQLNQQRQRQGQPPLRFKLVGGGPLDGVLRQQAEALGLMPHCLHWGEVARHDDVIAHVKSARLLLLPSTREGFGLVLAEAMAAGTAMLAYDIAAVRETLGPDLAGALVAPGDVPALAALAQRLLDAPAEHAALVAVGRQRVAAQFDLGQFAQRVLAVYGRTIDTSGD